MFGDCRHFDAVAYSCSGGRAGRALGRGPCRARCLDDVLAIYVHGITDESGTSVAIASVSLLEAIQLELGMQLFEEAHGGYGSTVSMRIGNVQESTNVSRRDRKQCGSRGSELYNKSKVID